MVTVQRLRRALRRPPRYWVWRLRESIRHRAKRPWSAVYPRLLTERALLVSMGARDIDRLWDELAQRPFFVSAADRQATAAAFGAAFPERRVAVIEAADAILRHQFDLLGSGPQMLGTPLPWHTDFKSGRRWPMVYCTDITYGEPERPSDVKVPWELSRSQHFTRLGQAYWLTGDERYAAEFAAEVDDWIDANPFARGVNWTCAMDVALRAVSWIWAFHFFCDSDACRRPAFRSRFLRALFLHGSFIVQYLEKSDLNGNHYLCDAVGLVFLGCFFNGSRPARRWLQVGRAIVEQEIFNQTTADGVDFEQSTAYHRLVLEAFLTSYVLLQRSGQQPPAACITRLERMCEFVAAYTKPNGLAPLVGDADDGRVQILGSQPINDHRYLLSSAAILFERGDFKTMAGRCWEETFWLLGRDAPARFGALPDGRVPGSQAFRDSGFYVLRGQDAHVFVDCGEVGFGGRGGHGHNDILSFELFLNGFNVVTDCGAYIYTVSREWRNRFRSTAFHNTVQIDGEELNRFISPDALWQLQYDATPAGTSLECSDTIDTFQGSHRGYERLADPVSHVRRIAVDKRRSAVVVTDRISGRAPHDLVWRFHLDPSVAVEIDGGYVRIAAGQRVVWLMPHFSSGAFGAAIEDAWVSPSYGVKVPAKVAVWSGRAAVPLEASFMFADRRLATAELALESRTAVPIG